jgi:hypothetical protein
MGYADSSSLASIADADKQGEQVMSKFLNLSLAAFACAACFGAAQPAAANTYEYCRKDVTSAIQQCGFETLAQCQAMAAGRGGDCYRDPLVTGVRSSYAYAPPAKHKHHQK